jgi:hypothetical protein
MKTSILSALTIVVLMIAACKKQEHSNTYTSAETMGYTGSDSFLLRILQEAQALRVAPDLEQKPAWDKVFYSISLADTFLHVMIPVVGDDGLLSDYVKLYLDTRTRKVVKGRHHNFEKDYKNNTDTLLKVGVGSDLRIFRSSGVKLPGAFSDSSWQTMLRHVLKSRKKAKATNGRMLMECTTQVDASYSYIATQACQDILPQIENFIITVLTANLRRVASETGGDFSLNLQGDGLLIYSTYGVVGAVEYSVRQAFDEALRVYAGCLVSQDGFMAYTECNDGGGGGGEGPPNDPEEPSEEDVCAGKLSEEEGLAILQQHGAASQVITNPPIAFEPVFDEINPLHQNVGPKWEPFYRYPFLYGRYSEFTAFFVGVIDRKTTDDKWKWQTLSYSDVTKSFNNMPGCVSVDVKVNSTLINFSADSTTATIEMNWTYTCSIPVLWGSVKTWDDTLEGKWVINAKDYEKKE